MQVYLGYLFIFMAALCWGFLGVLGRAAMSSGAEPLDVAFWRALLCGVFMLMHACFIKDIRVHSIKHLGVFIFFGVVSIASLFLVYQYAINDGGVALASVLLYTAPAWVALFSRIFFGVVLTKVTFLAILIALLGVSLISFSSSTGAGSAGVPLSGIIFGLLSGFFYATHYVVTKKYLTIYSPFALYGYGSIIAAACLLPFANLGVDVSAKAWLSILGIGFISSYLAYWSYCEGIKRLQATKAAVIANLEPVIATLAAWYLWDEKFTLLGWVGACMILGTVFLLVLEDKRKTEG